MERNPKTLARTAAAFSILALAACSSTGGAPESPPMAHPTDEHSFGNPSLARVVHGEMDWTLDFAAQQLTGSVTWIVERSSPDAPLILDTNGLAIEKVEVGDHRSLREVPVTLRDPHPVFGQALVVPMRDLEDHARITYHTRGGGGLQWLAPGQTAGGRLPFMFSQAQSIMARTFLPCQDSPAVRFTYAARVKAPGGMRPVMAAGMEEARGSDGAWHFEMPEPIPSYLLAIACGDLEFRVAGPRTRVWAEPPVVEKAAFEFADTEAMIRAAEALYGPYRWERYDILVLPPSFPFGGMENPRLTFATPTILAGDRSLVALVAHELAHSWSGNLVTNATWSDFWLNEGFTVYFERRIMEAVYGSERAEMEALLGFQDLLEDMKGLDPRDTRLKTDLKGRDPDDAFSHVPYEKGYLFLRLIEETIGRERLDPFLLRWFSENAFTSKTTEDFLEELHQLLTEEQRAALRIDAWVYGEGIPDNRPALASPALEPLSALADTYARGGIEAPALRAEAWIFHQWLHFLRSLPPSLSRNRMADLDLVWRLTASGNSEILHQWLLLAVRTGYEPAMPALERFLTTQGRRKFLKPLYEALAETPEGLSKAREIYSRARAGYHSLARNTLDGILGHTAGR